MATANVPCPFARDQDRGKREHTIIAITGCLDDQRYAALPGLDVMKVRLFIAHILIAGRGNDIYDLVAPRNVHCPTDVFSRFLMLQDTSGSNDNAKGHCADDPGLSTRLCASRIHTDRLVALLSPWRPRFSRRCCYPLQILRSSTGLSSSRVCCMLSPVECSAPSHPDFVSVMHDMGLTDSGPGT